MQPFTNRARQIARGIAFSAAFIVFQHFGIASALAQCAGGVPTISNPNKIVTENCLAGAPQSEWDVVGSGDPDLQGFASDISYAPLQTVDFKIKANVAYHIDIYRLGFYEGLGARKVASIGTHAAPLGANSQLACITEPSSNMVDCAGWSITTSWTIPANTTSGIYVAKLTRDDNVVLPDGSTRGSHIPFIVRDDTGASDVLFQTSDTTWQAYNSYGGFSLFTTPTASTKVSYNRPFDTRALFSQSFLFNAEYPALRWLEMSGYDVSYTTGVDSARRGNLIQNHKIFMSVGHDALWSADQRANVEAARDLTQPHAPVHLIFWSGGNVFWRFSWGTNFNPATNAYTGAKDFRTIALVGTWRSAGLPENSLTGTLAMVKNFNLGLDIPYADGKLRFWRNTSASRQADPTQVANMSFGVIGHEWNEDPADANRPPGQIRLSTTSRSGVPYLQPDGSYQSGTATHYLTMHRTGQSLIFSAATVNWGWGLDGTHDGGGGGFDHVPDLRAKLTAINLLADLGAQPQTLEAGFSPATASTDVGVPTSATTFPAAGATLPSGTQITITGTAQDNGGGVVGGVEISTNGGVSWFPVDGRESWQYRWTPGAPGAVTIKTRASDDSLNLETPGAGTAITVGPAAPIACPCSIWSPVGPGGVDGQDGFSSNVGVRFRSDIAGFVKGIRFYKVAANTGTHVGMLFNASGPGTTPPALGSATFTDETATGWQEVRFATPVPISANTTYVAAYFAPDGHYAKTPRYFKDAGVDTPPLHALRDNVDGPNGLFAFRAGDAHYPDTGDLYSNYWVDVVFDTVANDTAAPTVISTYPPAGSSVFIPNENVTVTFNEPMAPASITNNTIELRTAANVKIPATVTYNGATKTATLDPSSLLTYGTPYTVTVKGGVGGVTDTSNNPLAANLTFTFNTIVDPGCPCSFWNNVAPGDLTPPATVAEFTDIVNPFTAGMNFRAGLNGYIKAIRVYRMPGETAAMTAQLWNTGQPTVKMADVAVPAGTGWVEAAVNPPVFISGDTFYTVSYHTPVGHPAYTEGYFNNALNVGPLHAPDRFFPNGVHVFGAIPDRPRDNATGTNYWVDVVFDPLPNDLQPPVVTTRSPGVNATVVAITTNVDVSFNELLTTSSVTPTSFQLLNNLGNPVAAAVSYDPSTNIATLNPTSNLNYSATYTVVLHGGTGGIQDLAGNPLAANVTWNFTTAAAPPVFNTTNPPDVTVLEDSGAYSQQWATNIQGASSFLVDVANPSLFATAPAVSPSGVLTFTPAPNAYGSSLVTVTAANSEDTRSGPVSFTIFVTSVNDAPTFTSGSNIVSPEDAAYSAQWATAISAGPNEASQTLTFLVSNDNNSIFATQPAISPTGVLTFTPVANAHSTATVSVRLQDDGGTANGGSDRTSPIRTFTIQIASVNDAPSFTKGPDKIVVDTAGAQSFPAWATNLNAGAPDEVLSQALDFIVTNDHNAFFSAQPQVSSNGTLTFTPAPGQSGVATVSVRIHDDGGTDNGGIDTSAIQTFTITIDRLPVITSANATTFTVGSAGTFTVTTTGSPVATIARGGVALPGGVSFTDNGNGTGTLSGTPQAGSGGSYAISFTATNRAGSSSVQSFTLTVNESPAITSATSATFSVGTASTFTVTTTGFPRPSIARGGVALPSGLSFTDQGNGTATLAGTPATGTGGNYAFTFTATNSVSSTAPQSFTLAINEAPIVATSPSNQTACVGTQATFTAAASGFPAPTVRWQVSANGGSTFTDIPLATSTTLSFTTTLADNGKLYRAIFTSGPNSAATTSASLTVIDNPTPVITPQGSTTFCSGNSVTLRSSSATGNEWFRDGVSVGTTSGSDYVATLAGNYTVKVTNGICVSALSAAITVTVNATPVAPLISTAGSLTFCDGGSVILDSNSGAATQWFRDGIAVGTGTHFTAMIAGSYTATITTNGCPSVASNALIVTVNPTPAAPVISTTGAMTFCDGGSVILDANTGATTQWYRNNVAVGTGAHFTATLAGTYTATITTGTCPSTASNSILVSVTTLPAAPHITALGPTTFCDGSSVVLNSDAGSATQWFRDSTLVATGSQYTAMVAGSYTATITSSGCPSPASNAIPVSVTPLPAAPQITAAGPITFCDGGSVVLNANSGATTQWFRDSALVGTGAQFTAMVAGSYTATITSSGCPSPASNAITVTVNATPAAPIISTAGQTTFCSGGSVVLDANTGATTQWFRDGSSVGTGAQFTATVGGTYTAKITTGSCPSAASNGITVTVNAPPAAPIISTAGQTTFCDGGSVVLDANTGATTQWFRDGSSVGTGAQFTATVGGTYTAKITTGSCPSAASNGITVTVNATPVAPIISTAGQTTFCDGGSVILDANTGATTQWFRDGISVGTGAQFTATIGGTYTAKIASGTCTSAASNGITVTVNTTPAAPTISTAGQTTFCSGGSVVLDANTGATTQWFRDGVSVGTGAQFTATVGGTYTAKIASGTCTSAASNGITVTVNTTPAAPTISTAGQTTFCSGGSVTLDANTGATTQWFRDGVSVGTGAQFTASVGGTYTAKIASGTCTSTASNGITVTVNTTPAAPIISTGGETTFCSGGSVVLDANTGATTQWFRDGVSVGTGAQFTATVGGTYTAKIASGTCTSAASNGITVTVNTTPAAPVISTPGPTTFCQGSSTTLNSDSGAATQWFRDGIAAGTGAQLTVTVAGNYTAKVSNGTCTSGTSNSIGITVNTTPAAPVISTPGPTTFCQGSSTTLNSDSGAATQWFRDGIAAGTGAQLTVTVAGNYTAKISNGTCTSATSNTIGITVNSTPTAPVISTAGQTTFCDGGNVVLDADTGAATQWFRNNVAVGTGAHFTATLAGSYTATITSGSCPSAASNAIVVNVTAPPAAPSISTPGPTTFCQGGSVVLDSNAGPTTQWFRDGTAVGTGAQFTATLAGSYTAKITSGSCTSAASNAISVTVNATPTAPVISTPGPTTFCQGGSVVLNSDAGPATQWFRDGTAAGSGAQLTVTVAGSYTAKVSNGTCTSAASNAIGVTVNATPTTPVISTAGQTTFCEGGSVTLDSTGGAATQWFRNNTAVGTGAQFVATLAGNYTATLTSGSCTSAVSNTITVTVNAKPAAPSITAPSAVSAGSSGNLASGPSGATTYAWSITNGTISGAANGSSISFAPSVSTGSVTLQLTVTNANGCSATSSIDIPINANQAPVAVNDTYSAQEDTTLTVLARGVLTNDTDAEGNALTAILGTAPPASAGTLVLNSDGGFVFTPAAQFNGSTSFTYRASDGQPGNLATVTINVAPVNDPPSISAIAAKTVNELTLVSFTATASDVDGDTLHYSLVGAPAGASIGDLTGAFTWTPNEAQGPNSYNFIVHVSDGTTFVETPVSITVNEVNVPPVLTAIGNKTATVGVALAFLATATDVDLPANTLTFSLSSGAPAGASITPAGAFTFTPVLGQAGATYPITVNVFDGLATTSETIQVTVPAVISQIVDLDFLSGTTDCRVVNALGETKVTLPGGLYESFSAWPITGWSGAGTANGQLTVDGAMVSNDTLVAGPRSLEFVATFGAEQNQQIGFGQNLVATTETWALFSRFTSTSGLYARVNKAGTMTDTLIPGTWTGQHTFRIDWNAATVVFSIDGNVVNSTLVTIPVTTTMRPVISDATAGGSPLIVDWMRMGPYTTTCAFTSRVIDGGSSTDWDQLVAATRLPSLTSIRFDTRSGDTPTPDATWTSWLSLANTVIPNPNSRYIQYRATLATTDALGAPDLQKVTINPVDPVITINDVVMTEGNSGASTALFTVSLLKTASVPVTVKYATATGSAVSPSDYAAANGTLTFPAGVTTLTIPITVYGDTMDEDPEMFYVNLSDPTNAIVGKSQGSATVTNDDVAPAVWIADASMNEGNSGTQLLSFAVTLSAPSGKVVTVKYATADNTAIATDDYFAKTGTVTFQPGVTTATVQIQIKPDTKYEDDETFYVNLNTPSNCTINDGQAIGTLRNDDNVPTISINDLTIVEGNVGTKNAVFTVNMSNACGRTVTVNYTTVGGTAIAGTDFVLNSGTLTFAAGQTSQTIWIVINGDTLVEPSETFSVNLSNITPTDLPITFTKSVGNATITNDD